MGFGVSLWWGIKHIACERTFSQCMVYGDVLHIIEHLNISCKNVLYSGTYVLFPCRKLFYLLILFSTMSYRCETILNVKCHVDTAATCTWWHAGPYGCYICPIVCL